MIRSLVGLTLLLVGGVVLLLGAGVVAWITEDDGHVWAYTDSSSPSAVAGFIDLGPAAVEVLPLPLYAITGHGAALPPTEGITASYASITAFETAVVPAAQGERVQLAHLGQVRLLEGRWVSGSWQWMEV